MKASLEGNDALVARGSRTAASTPTPSDQTAHGTGPTLTACVTPPHVEALADHRRRHKHPPSSFGTRPCEKEELPMGLPMPPLYRLGEEGMLGLFYKEGGRLRSLDIRAFGWSLSS